MSAFAPLLRAKQTEHGAFLRGFVHDSPTPRMVGRHALI